MRILVLTSTFGRWPNDTEPRFVDDLCAHLARDHAVDVVAPHAPSAAKQETMGKVRVFRFQYCLERWEQLSYGGGILPNIRENRLRLLLVPLFLLAQLKLVLQLLRKNEYDVIHAHWIIPQGLVTAMITLLNKSTPPVVVTSHGGDLFALKGGLMARLKQWVTHKADHLTVVSSAMKSRAQSMGLKADADVSFIPMGTDANSFTPPDPTTTRNGLLFVGRLVDKKGISYLLDAMPRILKEKPGTNLRIIGSGPLLQPLQQQSRALGIEHCVSFLGALPNHEIPGHLKQAAVTVFPSLVTDSGDQEGTPVAIMEALACECPCVVSDYPGARDIIDDGRSGLLAQQKSAEALAKKITWLLDNPDAAKEMGREGRKVVQAQYDWQVVSHQFEELFDRLGQQPNISKPAHEN